MFRRATSIPARIRTANVAGSWLAGQIVETIFVRNVNCSLELLRAYGRFTRHLRRWAGVSRPYIQRPGLA